MSEQSNNQRSEIGKLHANEAWLIQVIRHDFPFGEVTIICQDGIPIRIKKVQYNIIPKKNE